MLLLIRDVNVWCLRQALFGVHSKNMVFQLWGLNKYNKYIIIFDIFYSSR